MLQLTASLVGAAGVIIGLLVAVVKALFAMKLGLERNGQTTEVMAKDVGEIKSTIQLHGTDITNLRVDMSAVKTKLDIK
jgi:hypothetical protein